MPLLDELSESATTQLNEELMRAQLELLSAQCATDSFRFRYPAEKVARYAQRDVLKKAVSSANTLFEYYNHVARLLPAKPTPTSARPAKADKEQTTLARVAEMLRFRTTRQRE